MISQVTLRNGAEVPDAMVRVTMLSLEHLAGKNPIALYELAMLCRDSRHVLFGNTGEVLRELALLNDRGKPSSYVKDIVLSAVAGDDGDMHLQSPLPAKEGMPE